MNRLSAITTMHICLLMLLAFRFAGHATGSDRVCFETDVKPILAKRCFACHGPETSEGGLSFDDADSAFGELDSGLRAIIPGNPTESELLDRMAVGDDYRTDCRNHRLKTQEGSEARAKLRRSYANSQLRRWQTWLR